MKKVLRACVCAVPTTEIACKACLTEGVGGTCWNISGRERGGVDFLNASTEKFAEDFFGFGCLREY